jgi:hypothetical protein
MKISVIKCQICGKAFASCYIDCVDDAWKIKVYDYKKHGCDVAIIESKDLEMCKCDHPATTNGEYLESIKLLESIL